MIASIEDQLAALTHRVATLERRPQQQSEQNSPNYLTTAPDGTVGANFTGHIHAQGLDLDAGTSLTPPTTDRVRWLRTSDGSTVADLFGAVVGGIRTLRLNADATAGELSATALLQAINNDTGAMAFLEAQIGGGLPDLVAQTTNVFRVLLRDDGASSFLQSGATQLSGVGSTTISWPGATPFSNTTNVALFGASGNVFAIASCDGIAGTTDAVVMNVHNVGNGTVDLRGKTAGGGNPLAASSATVYYLLWGS